MTYFFEINKGSLHEPNYCLSDVEFDTLREAHEALIHELERIHPGQWLPNEERYYGVKEILEVPFERVALAHINRAANGEDGYEFPFQYIFREGCSHSPVAGYVREVRGSAP